MHNISSKIGVKLNSKVKIQKNMFSMNLIFHTYTKTDFKYSILRRLKIKIEIGVFVFQIDI